MVVRHLQPSCGSLLGTPTSGPSVLVRRVRSWMGCESPGPIHLQSLVSEITHILDQSQGTPSHSSRFASFSTFPAGSVGWYLLRKYDSSVLHQVAGGNVFIGSQKRGSTSPLGGLDGHSSGAPIHHEGEECRRGFPESSTSGSVIQVDPGSGGGRRVAGGSGQSWSTSANSFSYRLSVYFSPLNNPMAAGTDAFLQNWDSLQAYVFPPFALIRQVVSKFFTCKGTLLTLKAPFWP